MSIAAIYSAIVVKYDKDDLQSTIIHYLFTALVVIGSMGTGYQVSDIKKHADNMQNILAVYDNI